MSAMTKEVLLSVRELSTWFELRRWGFGHAGYVRAVNGLSFDLMRGEAVAVVGESGCGKSTLARTILGLYPPNRGEITFEGEDISHIKTHGLRWYRSQVGYIQQDPYGALAPFMSVYQILQEPLIINGIKSKSERTIRISVAMEAVKLSPPEVLLPKFPHMLSGGQQQRVVIARAIILRPKLIVADEPVSMLDASARLETLQLLEQLKQTYNLSVIYVTHDLATVRYFSERVFVMYAGEIIEKAEVDGLLNAPFHPYSRALIAAIPDPDPLNAKTYRDVPGGEPPSLLNPPSGCKFHPRCPSIIRGLCDLKNPPEFEPSSAHFVKCWLFKK
ncbi:MAG: ABC transporter ATP-binding protein [Chloroflexi bacterium]|nr:ABC transporter ATP-binding protein [Chloroflexota bacterium]